MSTESEYTFLYFILHYIALVRAENEHQEYLHFSVLHLLYDRTSYQYCKAIEYMKSMYLRKSK